MLIGGVSKYGFLDQTEGSISTPRVDVSWGKDTKKKKKSYFWQSFVGLGLLPALCDGYQATWAVAEGSLDGESTGNAQ